MAETSDARRRILELHAQGLSQNAIARRLTDEHIPTPRGGLVWTHRQVVQHGWPAAWAAWMRAYRRRHPNTRGRP
jgi:hypothetical protein